MSHKYYHKNKACCILMGIKIFAKKYAWIKLTKKQRNSKFSWELEQKNSKFSWKLQQKCYFVSLFQTNDCKKPWLRTDLCEAF